jgi:hypothetical protein
MRLHFTNTNGHRPNHAARINDIVLDQCDAWAISEALVHSLLRVDEAENFVGFLALTNVGVGLAEHLRLGILGQEDRNTGFATTSLLRSAK